MDALPVVGFGCIVAGMVLMLVGGLRSGVGVGPVGALLNRMDPVENTARAARNPRRVLGARLQVAALVLMVLGMLLAAFPR